MTDRQTDRRTDGQTDRQTDGQTDGQTDARGKTICLPTLKGGDINSHLLCLLPASLINWSVGYTIKAVNFARFMTMSAGYSKT